jgi:transcriptional regulator GlxA family with amidase domain
MGNRVLFFIASHVHALDLAGPLQVFYEAAEYGNPYEIMYVSHGVTQLMSAGLGVTGMVRFGQVKVNAGDIIFIPGFVVGEYIKADHTDFYRWLQQANEVNAVICSICTGAFALAQAGLLNGIACTTHWRYVARLQQQFPQAVVMQNQLFVNAGNIYTSAGITTGIDMALHIMEQRHGAQFAWQLARELVVYIRRNGDTAQESIYLQHRQHINDQVHAVQDWIIHHLHQKITIEGLAELVFMSPRNLTRMFKSVTGITIGDYLEKIRVEKALQLLNTGEKTATVTHECGFKSPTQLRTILQKHARPVPSALC